MQDNTSLFFFYNICHLTLFLHLEFCREWEWVRIQRDIYIMKQVGFFLTPWMCVRKQKLAHKSFPTEFFLFFHSLRNRRQTWCNTKCHRHPRRPHTSVSWWTADRRPCMVTVNSTLCNLAPGFPLIPTKPLFVCFCDLNCRHIPFYLVFNFQELVPSVYTEKLGQNVCLRGGNFFRGRKRGSERKRENRVRVCHMSQKSLFIAVFHFSSQTRRRGDRLKSFIQTSMIRQNI